MRFWAKLKLEGEQAGRLIKEFFVYFNPENSILIKGDEATVEIVFDKSPNQCIIQAIADCRVIDFLYEGTKKLPHEIAKLAKQEQKQAEEGEESTTQHKEAPKVQKPRQKLEKKEEKPTKDVLPVLDEIAGMVHTYEEFVMAVSIWLGLNSKQEAFFKEVVEIATNLEKISWKRIKEEMENKGEKWYGYGQIQCSEIVTDKFKNINPNVTIMNLIKAIVQYRTFEFKKVHEEEKASEETSSNDGEISEETEVLQTSSADVQSEEAKATSEEEHQELKTDDAPQEAPPGPNDLTPKRIEHMPDIPFLTRAIERVNKTKPIEVRVRNVLESMGLNGRTKPEIQEILSLASEAMRVKDSSEMSGLDVSAEAWVAFAELLDDFMKRCGHGAEDEMVRVEDFLSDLQKVILTEEELASL